MTKLGKEIQRGVIAALVSFMCLHTAVVFAASPNTRNTVRGKIVNETGEPIIGAIVTLKGNKNVGTTTDVDGNFVLAYNDHKAEALNVNYIGCSSMEVEVKEGEENVGTIKMSQDAYSLQDVVVIGYGETSREKLVGSVAKVKGDVIATQTQDAPILGLQGNAAGVYIEECSGVPGSSNSTIVVRGYNALTTNRYNNMPLYIVDGIPFANTDNNPISEIKEGVFEYPDPLALINPSDIESIEILKDADATAIYGTRGANGVVLV
ncbi:MAG: TonB-dependent receptor plug domain-containing protein, partial [Prevotella sp.]|nr:TonB-dependent receptor plug domain-containing protein [Prevotella sp.]